MIERVLSDASFVEIAERKKRLGCELRASLYLFADTRLLVTSMAGIAEYGEVTILARDASCDEIGLSVCDHLVAFDPRNPDDLQSRKPSDWGAFRASGARSVRSFKEKSWIASIRTAGVTIAVEAAPLRSLHEEIRVLAHENPVHHALGETIRRTLAGARALRAAGIV